MSHLNIDSWSNLLTAFKLFLYFTDMGFRLLLINIYFLLSFRSSTWIRLECSSLLFNLLHVLLFLKERIVLSQFLLVQLYIRYFICIEGERVINRQSILHVITRRSKRNWHWQWNFTWLLYLMYLWLVMIDRLSPIRLAHEVACDEWSTMMRSFRSYRFVRIPNSHLKHLYLSLGFLSLNHSLNELIHIISFLLCRAMSHSVIIILFWILHLTFSWLTSLFLRLLLNRLFDSQCISKFLHLQSTFV